LRDLLASLEAHRESVGAARVPVLLPLALPHTYDNAPPEGMTVAPGAFAFVSFGAQSRVGIVWDVAVTEGSKPVTGDRLKPIVSVLADVPPLPTASLRFAEWVARYTLSPLGMVARMMMPPPELFVRGEPRFGVRRNADAPAPARMTPARRKALEIDGDDLIRAKGALSPVVQSRTTTSVIEGIYP